MIYIGRMFKRILYLVVSVILIFLIFVFIFFNIKESNYTYEDIGDIKREVPFVYADFNEWDNRVDIFQINREYARSFFIPYSDIRTLMSDVKKDVLNSVRIKDSSNVLSLNGRWKFSIDYKVKDRNMDFFRNDYDVSKWEYIDVPSNWQMKGYDFPIYVNFRYPWTGFENLEFYKAPQRFNPIGNYKRSFVIDESWINDKVYISFQGVESCFYLWINGNFVGYSEDSFSPSEFDITDFIVPGENDISVQVFRWCDGSFIEDQDFIRLSGIFRDVFLYRTPMVNIRDFEVITELDPSYIDSKLIVNVNLLNHFNDNRSYSVSAILFDNEWNLINKADSIGDFNESYLYNGKIMQCNSNISFNVHNPLKWSAEDPNLYNLILCLKNDQLKETQCIHTRVGFRKFEMKDNKMCINGKPILFKGVNRHETHPYRGRALLNSDMEFDVKEIKRNNINSVRTSHYPNHPYFISLCNEFGIYLIDEANIEAHGVEGEIPGDKGLWAPSCFDRIVSMIERDKNNPSVLMWSLGNESGGGSIFRELYSYVKNRDTTRLVHYEGERDFYYASDVVSKMYVRVDDIEDESKYIKNKPYILCEYAHSMGNSGGGLKRYMDKFESLDNVQGGFIWDFIDQGVYKETPSVGVFSNIGDILQGDFEGYIRPGYRGNGFSGSIVYGGSSNIKFSEFTIDLKVKPSVYEGEGCIYLKKGHEFGLREVMNYNNSNNRALELYVRDNSGIYETIVYITPDEWENNWHRVTASCGNNLLRLFIDGMLIGEKLFNYNVGHFRDVIQVGGNDSYNHFESMNGILDEVKLLYKVMEPDEIDSIKKYDRSVLKIIWNDFDNKRDFFINKKYNFKYLASGGDFNDSPNDSSFCANGILLSSRKSKPQIYDVKSVYQNVDVEDFNILEGSVLIKNKNLFKNLGDYTIKWDYLVDGVYIEGGSMNINIDPLESGIFTFTDIGKILNMSGKEFFVNIRFLLNEDTLWANRGFEVAKAQLKIPLSNHIIEASYPIYNDNFTMDEDMSTIYVKSNNILIEFDKHFGALKKYVFNDVELINSLIIPEFWNPLNDNERLYKIYSKICFWKDVFINNVNSTYEYFRDEDKNIIIKFNKVIHSLDNSVLSTTYIISDSGEVKVNLHMDVLKEGIPNARSVGFKIFIPNCFDKISFYGRGPVENYNDRNNGSFVGVYNTDIYKQFTDYMTPQRTGNLTDVRWAFFHNNGTGLLLKQCDDLLQINAGEYNDREFEKKHSYQMVKYSSIIVNIRSKDYGSTFESFEDSGIDYTSNTIYDISFILSPFINNSNPMENWKKSI